MADTPQRLSPQQGLLPRVMQSWVAPRKVVRGLSAMPEGGIFAVLMIALLLLFVSLAPGQARLAGLDPSMTTAQRLAGVAMVLFFIAPVVFYILAWLSGVVMRLFGRPLALRHARLALFWALLAASPALLFAGLASGIVGESTATVLARGVAAIGFLVIWGAGLLALSEKR
ncbi:MAG: hypothetical protein Q4G24_02720 [Paracoccus sp. (in: a-proteobacteria)]|uniref:hypothetical protein n=1 Tax=Paracoccus sp. TaxID=267 RepID=UPI0026E06D7D|nr:hypothetical protein [Paracoccus sp. (in: a-proteobacteria)]MDO5620365.1 hypothetical protein [Paracoccus sp. (in: a-proteobacteria)]